jgi:hypothetical protein
VNRHRTHINANICCCAANTKDKMMKVDLHHLLPPPPIARRINYWQEMVIQAINTATNAALALKVTPGLWSSTS